MSRYYQLDMIAKAIKPELVNGVWRKAKLSGKRVARIRKECLQFGTINGVQAEWNPEWDRPKKSWLPRPPKGHAFDRMLPQRIALIDKNMKEMPKMVIETRKEAYLSKPHTFLKIMLEPEDYDAFYKIGRTVTHKMRKEDREKATKAAEEAEKAAKQADVTKTAKLAKKHKSATNETVEIVSETSEKSKKKEVSKKTKGENKKVEEQA